MTMLESLLRVAGATQMALAIAHLGIGRHLDWAHELARLSPVNRQIFHVHCFFICLVLLLMGAVSLFAPDALLERSRLGLLAGGALAIFWIARLFAQWFVYDRALWRGKRFETAVHGVFTMLWAFYSAVYSALAWTQWQ